MYTQDAIQESNASTSVQFSSDNGHSLTLDKKSILVDATALGSKKRKRNENFLSKYLNESFVPYPVQTISTNICTLQPVLLVRRSDLPLSSLDFQSSAKSLGQTRLFEADLKILELEKQVDNQPLILVARHKDSKSLFALERESQGLYALFQIGSWVNLQQLLNVAVATKQDSSELSLLSKTTSCQKLPQPNNFSVPNISSKKRIAIQALQSKLRRPSNPTESPTQHKDEHPIELTKAPLSKNYLPHDHGQLESEPTPSDLAETSETIRTQYFEILYLSKASLAYFAKGPLSRARAMFLRSGQPNNGLGNHISFLESLILTISHLDKKYKFGIPLCISSIENEYKDTPNRDGKDATKGIKKTSRKMKRDKNGLYPGEDILIQKWCSTQEDDVELSLSELSTEQLIKIRTSQLRTRETQLQILLILEVLALRPLNVTHDHGENPGNKLLTTSNTSTINHREVEIKNSKKKGSLSLLIDIHVDRLCIWQSVAIETPESISTVSHNTGAVNVLSEIQVKYDENALKDFCTDVIIPFFSSRLPNQCALINSKLGGPVGLSSSKIQLSKTSKSSKPPGAITERSLPKEARRIGKQTHSKNEENRRDQGKAHSTLPNVKPSRSVPKIAAIRKGTRMPTPIKCTSKVEALEANRSGVFRSKRFAQREVNFNSIVVGMDIKAKKEAIKASKDANIESGLSHAISLLRKPNRRLAVEDLFQPDETKYTSPLDLQDSKTSKRDPNLNKVQICATPKSRRTKVFPVETPAYNLDISRSSPTQSPSSPKMAHVKESQLYPIQVTPTKKSRPLFSRDARENDSHNQPYFHYPLQSNHQKNSDLFLSAKEVFVEPRKINEERCGVIDTPAKGVLNDISCSKSLNESAIKMGGLTDVKSFNESIDNDIYEELGWNEDII
ncbi:SLD3 domain-containing DNA replication regulator protein [Blumeria hordei DH14]|uniref:SLD3 domain-containing DNA replication regulator protein n=1 Tax=Blumeria graminis f. sp. hordei (strain DH14) TaxID=546991 RepID=N1J7X5_BLUG1|nr:SLD3 domain-containing DNA replication regulator protein [Blumeria hordei DH14]